MKFYQKSINSTSPNQTKKLGVGLAKKILKANPKKTAIVLGLEGNLGGGKTTFLQGFAKGLGVKEKILSPTFILIKKFQIPNSKFQINLKFKTFYHLDCYRIEKSKEILDLGFKEIIKNPQNIIAIEWSERIKKILPKSRISIKFKILSRKERKITIDVAK